MVNDNYKLKNILFFLSGAPAGSGHPPRFAELRPFLCAPTAPVPVDSALEVVALEKTGLIQHRPIDLISVVSLSEKNIMNEALGYNFAKSNLATDT